MLNEPMKYHLNINRAPINCGCAVAVLFALLVIYVVAYYAMVDRVVAREGVYQPYKIRVLGPEYSYGNGYAELIFYPLHCIDRIVRPAYWRGDGESARPTGANRERDWRTSAKTTRFFRLAFSSCPPWKRT